MLKLELAPECIVITDDAGKTSGCLFDGMVSRTFKNVQTFVYANRKGVCGEFPQKGPYMGTIASDMLTCAVDIEESEKNKDNPKC